MKLKTTTLSKLVNEATAPIVNATAEDPTHLAAKWKPCLKSLWLRLALGVVVTFCVGLVVWLIRKIIQGPFYRKANRIDGKVVIVTGCDTGVGKETVLELARRGARIYMACRDSALCEAARLDIVERTQNEHLYNRSLDLASLESVRKFVARFKAEETRLDLLINNAGIMPCPRALTADGHEQQLGVNHLGHFLLTNLLLDRIMAASPSRIVVVSSVAHLFGRINREDLMSERRYKPFFGAYAQSKLANVLFTRKLAMVLTGTGVTVNCCHPGLMRTDLNRYMNGPRWLLGTLSMLSRFFLKSARAGAQTQLYLALDPDLDTSTGGIYADSYRWPLVPWARDVDTAEWLWRESEKLVGLSPPRRRLTHYAGTHVTYG